MGSEGEPGRCNGIPPVPRGRARRLRARVSATSVAALVGRGDGLTPLGDDVICGWLAAHRAAGVPTDDVDAAVRRLLPRTTTLSASLLECALAGEVADPVAAYLRSLGTPGAGAPRAQPSRPSATAPVSAWPTASTSPWVPSTADRAA